MHGQQGSTHWSHFFPRYRFLYPSSLKVGCTARKYQVNLLRQWTNSIGVEQELKKAYLEVDDRKIQSFLLEQGGDWIRWHKNPPLISHTGGVWERQIHSTRAILGSLLKTHGECLDDESLLTVMTEVEVILNSRSSQWSNKSKVLVTCEYPNHEIKGSFTTTRRIFQAWYI